MHGHRCVAQAFREASHDPCDRRSLLCLLLLPCDMGQTEVPGLALTLHRGRSGLLCIRNYNPESLAHRLGTFTLQDATSFARREMALT
jgi:hypothetical protein